MVLVSFDTNVLVYAIDPVEPEKHEIAKSVLTRAAGANAVMLQQTIGEFFNLVLKRKKLTSAEAIRQVAVWDLLFDVVPTRPHHQPAAARLAGRRRKQFWDMLIVRVAADAGAGALMSEDIGDGEVIDGVRIVNPFAAHNRAVVDTLLTPAS